MNLQLISPDAITRRSHWITEIIRISDGFGQDSSRVDRELVEEVNQGGISALIDHLRLCGAIPESYGHDSSEEKLYSKYTDVLLAVVFREFDLESIVLSERVDAADVEVVGKDYSFVADAKAFRLSRTAKNQKDFKVQSMDRWKYGKDYAMVVCPIYQFPARSSQIYQQAAARNVCILSYSHLAVLLRYVAEAGTSEGQDALRGVLNSVVAMMPSKNAAIYWSAVNTTLLNTDPRIQEFWKIEKLAAIDAISIAKEHALQSLAQRRESIMRLSRADAIRRLLEVEKLDSKMRVITAVSDNGLLAAS